MKSFTKYIAKRFANQSGMGGMIVAFVMNRQNRKQYDAVQNNINVQPTGTILDIEFGNGYLIEKPLKQNPQSKSTKRLPP